MEKYHNSDIYGNMRELTSSQDRMRNHTPKKHLGRKILGAGLILAGLGIGAYELAKKDIELNYFNQPAPSVYDNRARDLSTAVKQLSQATDPAEINGLNSMIPEIVKGNYDHK